MVFYLIFLEGFTRIRLLEMSSDLGIELCDDDDTVNMTISRRWAHFCLGIVSDYFSGSDKFASCISCHVRKLIAGRLLFVQDLVWKSSFGTKTQWDKMPGWIQMFILRGYRFQVRRLVKLEDSRLIWRNRMGAVYLHKHQIWEVHEGHGIWSLRTLIYINCGNISQRRCKFWKGLIILILYSSGIQVLLKS